MCACKCVCNTEHLPCTEVSGLLYVCSEVEVFIVFLWKMASVGCGTSILRNEHNLWQV